MTEGTVTFGQNTVTYEAQTLAGDKIKGTYTGNITYFADEEAPLRTK